MNFRVVPPALIGWLAILACAFVNGAFREAVITPRLGAPAAHVISTIILTCLILAAAFVFVGKAKDRFAAADMVLVGALWLILTVFFEFGLGLSRGMTGGQMLADYDILKGRIWILIPLTTALAPCLMYSLRQKYHF